MTAYITATSHYGSERWKKMVESMEASLGLYLREEVECRLHCDKPFDQKW